MSYVLWCTDCDEGFSSKDEWTSHLVFEQHQDQVLKASRTWTEADMHCCVVVFLGTGSRVSAIQILERFKELGVGLLASDLVLIPNRSTAMIVQFESRSKVDQLFSLLGGGTEIIMANQTLQMRRFMDYMPFERESFFPGIGLQQPPPKEMDNDAIGPSFPFNLKSLLLQDFADIRKEVEIPHETFQGVLTLLEKLQKVLSKHLSGCKLFLFRHYYLQLKNPGANVLLIFLHHDQLFEFNFREKFYWTIFQEANSRRLLPGLQKVPHATPEAKDLYGIPFQDSVSGLTFSLVDFGSKSTEMQTCQLLKHIIWRHDADHKLRALMMLVFYWAIQNEAPVQCIMTSQKGAASLTPTPSALEWLVIFFLTHHKLVPDLKQVLKPDSFDKTIESRFADPGFPLEPDFIDNPFLESTLPEDNPGFVISVVKLAYQFFAFYGDYIQKEVTSPCILNTRNGQIIKAESSGPANETSWHFQGTETKVGNEERRILSSQVFLTVLKKRFEHQKGRVSTPVHILHPLFFANRFPLDSCRLRKTWWKMSETGKQLRQLVQGLEHGATDNQGQLSLKEMLVVKGKMPDSQGKKRKLSCTGE